MKVLVALSGGHDEADDPVIAAVSSFPWPAGTRMRVLSVAAIIQPVTVGMIPDAIDAGDVRVQVDANAKSTAAIGVMELRQLGWEADAISLEGEPGTAIVDFAKQWGADVIVVGSHERSRIERLLMGSVSAAVIKESPCSVLVVKRAAGTPAR